MRAFTIVEGEGIEPSSQGPKSWVLPLNEPSIKPFNLWSQRDLNPRHADYDSVTGFEPVIKFYTIIYRASFFQITNLSESAALTN